MKIEEQCFIFLWIFLKQVSSKKIFRHVFIIGKSLKIATTLSSMDLFVHNKEYNQTLVAALIPFAQLDLLKI